MSISYSTKGGLDVVTEAFALNMETKVLTRQDELLCSPSPSEEEKAISNMISEMVVEHDSELLKEIGLMKINFQVKKRLFGFYIEEAHFVQENGRVISIPTKYKLKGMGNTYSTTLRKVGAQFMPNTLPTYLSLYASDLKEAHQEKVSWKLVITSVFTVITSWLGVALTSLVTGLFILALADLVLGLSPRNIKLGTEKDHTFQAKFLAFLTNFLGMIAIFKGMEYLSTFAGEKGVPTFVNAIIHIATVGWIFSIYVWRIIGYIARANNAKVPRKIKSLFDKDVTR
jgi:hypothetical protein